MTSIHRCTECRARFELPPGGDRETCRRCSGLICPLCSGSTVGGAVCRREGCQKTLAAAHGAALRADRRRSRERREKPWPRAVRRAG